MTGIRLYSAVAEMVGDYIDTAVVTDGSRILEASILLNELVDDIECYDVIISRGKAIHPIEDGKYLSFNTPKYRVIALNTVSPDEVREWFTKHIPSAIDTIDGIINSPLVRPRTTISGRVYWVWKTGLTPQSIVEVVDQIAGLLNKWVDADNNLTDEMRLKYQSIVFDIAVEFKKIQLATSQ